MKVVYMNATTRSYLTRGRALKAAEEMLKNTDVGQDVRVTVISDRMFMGGEHNTFQHRFSPVFFLTQNQMHLAQPLASRGFLVIG